MAKEQKDWLFGSNVVDSKGNIVVAFNWHFHHNRDMEEILKQALAGFAPKIADSYRAIVAGRFEAMTSKLGPFLKNVYNDGED